MIKCCICGREIISSDPYVLFQSTSGEDMHGCEACEKQMNTLMEGENPAEVKEAVNYFYTYAGETEDDEVKGFLEDIVESNAAAVDKLSAAQERKKLIEQRRRTLLRILVAIGLIPLIIACFVSGAQMFPERIGAGIGLISGGIILVLVFLFITDILALVIVFILVLLWGRDPSGTKPEKKK